MIYNLKFIILATLVLLDDQCFSSGIKQHDTKKQDNNELQLCIKLTTVDCESEEIIFLCDSKTNKMHIMKCLKVSEDNTCNPDSCMKTYFNHMQGLYFCNEIKRRCQEIGLNINGTEFYITYNNLSKIQNALILNNSFNGTYETLYHTNNNKQGKISFPQRFITYNGLSRFQTDNEVKYAKLNDELKGNGSDLKKYILSNKMIDTKASDSLNESNYSQFILGNFTYNQNLVTEHIQTIYNFKKILNTFSNVAYLKELPRQSHSDNLEPEQEFKCLQNGIHCADNNVLLHCVQISPDTQSELIPLFIFPCKVGAEGKDIISSQCLNNSCSVSVGNETTNLYLLPLLPGSLCDENLGTRCVSIILLIICTNNSYLPNYIVDCSGMQQRSNYFQNIQGRCDEMSSSCILDSVSNDWNNTTEISYTADTLSATVSTYPHDPYQTSLSVITNVSTSTYPTEINILETYEEVPLIKVSVDLNIQCWKSGWHCYNENILLFCSDELMVYNLTSCPDQYQGALNLQFRKKKSYCNSEIAKCEDVTAGNPLEYTEIEYKCQKTGLQCINEWKLADCGSNMETLFIISCKILFPLDPRATCNKTTDRCQSLQSDLNLLSTSFSSEEKNSKKEPDTQIRDKIGIVYENPNKRKIKNKGGSNRTTNSKQHPYQQKALRAFKSTK